MRLHTRSAIVSLRHAYLRRSLQAFSDLLGNKVFERVNVGIWGKVIASARTFSLYLENEAYGCGVK